jgi:Predicted transcriptional regulator, contains C-terminal CBS domains
MLVKDVMSRTVRTVDPETSMLEVSSLMCLYRFSGLPVVDNGKLVGFVAEKDVLDRLFPSIEDLMEGTAGMKLDDMQGQYRDLVKLKAADLMVRNVITVSPDMHALRAAAIMVRNRFRRIPVAEGETLIGMLSLGDIHKAIFHSSIAKMRCTPE